MNHDNHHDESKAWTHKFSKLPDDGDPWAPNNLLKIRSKRKTPVEPRWAKQQARSSGPNQLIFIALSRGHHSVFRQTHRRAVKDGR